MNWRRLLAMARKELIQIRRDPRSLFIALIMPVMQMAMLGYGVSLDAKHIPLYVYDQEGSQESQALLKRFQASEYFDLVKTVDNYRELTAAVDSDRSKLAVVIPFDFSERLRDANQTNVQVIVDGTDDNTANLATDYARAVIGQFSVDFRTEWLRRQGLPVGGGGTVSIEPRTWFNEDLESRNFIIPGIVALVMALVGALLTSLTISREWERGTMEQLISTPITSQEVMFGKLIPYFAIGLVDAAMCVAIGVWWFDVPFRGTLTSLFATTSLFLIVILGIGFMISVAIKSQLGASQIALLVTLLPTMMLSGFAFPIDQMPPVIRAITYVVYSRYYVTILKAIFLKGVGVRALLAPVMAMAIYAVVIGWMATHAFKKTLD
ncbi:MAG TPA: ABC transporter permease [Candidatus Binataceae bacterium]|nr:ABC transporter permease [Candidatus Binataceae bacterium]